MARKPQQRTGVNKILGKKGVIILDDVTEMPKVSAKCVLRVRPLTMALWKLYGAPSIAHHFHEWAFKEIKLLAGK